MSCFNGYNERLFLEIIRSKIFQRRKRSGHAEIPSSVTNPGCSSYKHVVSKNCAFSWPWRQVGTQFGGQIISSSCFGSWIFCRHMLYGNSWPLVKREYGAFFVFSCNTVLAKKYYDITLVTLWKRMLCSKCDVNTCV